MHEFFNQAIQAAVPVSVDESRQLNIEQTSLINGVHHRKTPEKTGENMIVSNTGQKPLVRFLPGDNGCPSSGLFLGGGEGEGGEELFVFSVDESGGIFLAFGESFSDFLLEAGNFLSDIRVEFLECLFGGNFGAEGLIDNPFHHPESLFFCFGSLVEEGEDSGQMVEEGVKHSETVEVLGCFLKVVSVTIDAGGAVDGGAVGDREDQLAVGHVERETGGQFAIFLEASFQFLESGVSHSPVCITLENLAHTIFS